VTLEVIDGLPADTPELKLAELLSRYRKLRNQRLAASGKRERAAENLVISNLQKRLLSSIAAFDRTLQVHRNTLEKRAAKADKQRQVRLDTLDLLQNAIDGDDERAAGDEEELLQEADAQHEAALSSALEASDEEWELLRQMQGIAQEARYQADSRVKRLETLIRDHLCPELGQKGAVWSDERLLIFTEYADTKDWLERRVRELIAGSDQAETRIATFHGGIRDERREVIKRSFNSPPQDDPLRILIATDAAREGVNLQNHCKRLVHFDVPWNPGRMEQRNGRIDRIGQTHKQIQIVNLHLDGTVEADVYRALKGRIAMFEQVVGKLQPILAKASSSISQATLVSRDQREKARASAVAAVEQESEIKGLDLDDVLQDLDAIREVVNSLQPSPLTLADLEAILRQPSLLPPGCSARPIGAYDFAWTQPGLDEEMRVTCNASYYEDNSDSCELWVPGSPLFPAKNIEELATGEPSISREELLQTISAASAHSP
jgi:superfamily II DNA/RNA helicase